MAELDDSPSSIGDVASTAPIDIAASENTAKATVHN